MSATFDQARQEFAATGYAVLRQAGDSVDDLMRLVNAVSTPRGGTFWPEIQMVHFEPGMAVGESVANSERRLLPHSDGSFEPSPPDMLFLQYVEPDLPGFGESRVVRAGDLATHLPRSTVEVLRRPEFHFVRCDDGRTALGRGPVLGIGDAPTIRFRHDEKYRIRADTAEGAAAVEELSDLVRQPSVQRPVALGRGDILWLDNRRNLHGRTALSGQATRTLRTAWGDERPLA